MIMDGPSGNTLRKKILRFLCTRSLVMKLPHLSKIIMNMLTIPSQFKINVFAVSIGNRVVSRGRYFGTANIFQNLPKYQPRVTFSEFLKWHKLLCISAVISPNHSFLFVLQGIHYNVNPNFYMYFPMSLLLQLTHTGC